MDVLCRRLSGCLASLVVFGSVAACPDLGWSEAPQIVHGTVIVVVSTKDGFVLAGDSQGSSGCQALPAEYEKVFPIGGRSAIAVAGLIGAQIEKDVAESIAADLHKDDQIFKRAGQQVEATRVISSFASHVTNMLGLLSDSVSPPAPIVAEASAVSINDQGAAEWVTLYLRPRKWKYSDSYESWGIEVDHFVDPPASKIVALGAGTRVVEGIINGGDPNNPALQDPAVKRYLLLKSENRLSELALADGVPLANVLVKAAILYSGAHSAECLGIGGDVQMLTVTAKGTERIHSLEKSKLAPPVPTYPVRVMGGSSMFGRVDGVLWARDSVSDGATITFSGDADAIVSQPRFEGKCAFVLAPGSQDRMPETAARLRAVFAPHCDVYQQTTQGDRLKLSAATASAHGPTPIDENDAYSSACNGALKSQAKALSAQLRTFGNEYSQQDLQLFLGLSQARRQAFTPEDRSVLALKWTLENQDRFMLNMDEYQRRFMPEAVKIRHELFKRVTVPADFVHWKTSELQWHQLAGELDALADLLPDSKCGAGQEAAKN